MGESRTEPESAIRSILGGEGLLLHLRTSREDDVLTARLDLERAEGRRPLLKLVVSLRLEDLDLSLGLDASEDELGSLSRKVRDLWEALRVTVPIEVTREK